MLLPCAWRLLWTMRDTRVVLRVIHHDPLTGLRYEAGDPLADLQPHLFEVLALIADCDFEEQVASPFVVQ